MFERLLRKQTQSVFGPIFPQQKASIFREIPVMHRLIHIIHRFSAEKVCSNPFSGRKSDFCSHLINFAFSTKFFIPRSLRRLFLHGLRPHKKHRMFIRCETEQENRLLSELNAYSLARFPAV